MEPRNAAPRGWIRRPATWLFASLILCCGCEAVSNRLTKWRMLSQEAMEDPIAAVGGRGTVFSPEAAERPRSRKQLAGTSAQELVNYYAPIFVQQRSDAASQRHAYPPEYDEIGEARLRYESNGNLKALVGGPPKVYAIFQKRTIGPREHVQLTYTAWYPAHPKMKAFDLEDADIDSCVVRVTLDADNAPLFYETIAACGCFHKVFVEKWLEDAACKNFNGPEKDKKFAVERTVKNSIDWEVAGTIDNPRERPQRPVVFIKAAVHKVIGMSTAAGTRAAKDADTRRYTLADYSELYSLPVANTSEQKPFFDLGRGGKVWGAERKERFVFRWIGVDDAGQPRAVDQIKLHFDQSTWDDLTIYERFLRLPPGTL